LLLETCNLGSGEKKEREGWGETTYLMEYRRNKEGNYNGNSLNQKQIIKSRNISRL